MRIERSGQKRCLQGPAVLGWQPVGGKPFGFEGERRVGRTGHSERLSAWRRISKGQGRKTTTTSKRVPRRTILYRGIIFDFLKVWKRWESKVSRAALCVV